MDGETEVEADVVGVAPVGFVVNLVEDFAGADVDDGEVFLVADAGDDGEVCAGDLHHVDRVLGDFLVGADRSDELSGAQHLRLSLGRGGGQDGKGAGGERNHAFDFTGGSYQFCEEVWSLTDS